MKHSDALSRIFAGMRADVHDYRRLRDLLEAQFGAALQHRTVEIGEIVERLTELTAVLEERRRERVEQAGLLAAGSTSRVTIASVAQSLQGKSRATFDACWTALEASVQECKALNLRNCQFLMDQRDIMQRVLNAEANTYAPA
jgi:flagella synthesis protein FlgN